MQNTKAGRRAEIAGAGIGGLTTAAALAQRGWSVTVHERASTLRTFGAGIYIWSNGLRVLKAIGAYDKATGLATVDVAQVVTAGAAPTKRHDPSHPLADADGNVFEAAVDETRELVDMLETARNYQNNVEVMQAAKSLILDTLKLGR